MGYYIETPVLHGKAAWLADAYDAELLAGPPVDLSELPEGKALVCVADNGIFEAAGYAFSDAELDAFDEPADTRPKQWLVMDKPTVEKLSGFTR